MLRHAGALLAGSLPVRGQWLRPSGPRGKPWPLGGRLPFAAQGRNAGSAGSAGSMFLKKSLDFILKFMGR